MQVRESVRQEAHAVNATLPATVKYYGKWPFTRVLGMQVCTRPFTNAHEIAHIANILPWSRHLSKDPPNVACFSCTVCKGHPVSWDG